MVAPFLMNLTGPQGVGIPQQALTRKPLCPLQNIKNRGYLDKVTLVVFKFWRFSWKHQENHSIFLKLVFSDKIPVPCSEKTGS